jgi:hypothetical protein
MNVSIISPISRPQNLYRMKDSIKRLPGVIDITWYLSFDMDKYSEFKFEDWMIPLFIPTIDKDSVSGNKQRNIALDLIQDGYVYFLDDDNIVHPDFLAIIESQSRFHPGYGFAVNQIHPNGATRLKAKKENMRVCMIDTAQYIIPRKFIGNTRWDVMNYCADGIFIETIYKNNSDKFIWIDTNLSYYNYLRNK